MESSSVLAFRIFVMLSCLIVVPMAAIFGSAFPDVVKTQLVDRIVAWSTGKPLESSSGEGDFSEVTSAPASNTARGNTGNWEAPRWGAASTAPASWQATAPGPGGVVPAGAQGVNPATGNQSASFAAVADSARGATGPYPLQRPAGETPNRGGPLDLGPAVAQSPAVVMPAGESRSAAVGHEASGEQCDRFTLMERKLREYGASYYLLETWGNDGDLYRFHCKMAVGANPSYTRHFEATDRDALRAMAQVLEKVEAWRAGRLP
jgi:hypothetical protein